MNITSHSILYQLSKKNFKCKTRSMMSGIILMVPTAFHTLEQTELKDNNIGLYNSTSNHIHSIHVNILHRRSFENLGCIINFLTKENIVNSCVSASLFFWIQLFRSFPGDLHAHKLAILKTTTTTTHCNVFIHAAYCLCASYRGLTLPRNRKWFQLRLTVVVVARTMADGAWAFIWNT